MMPQSHSKAYIWGENYNSKWYMHPRILCMYHCCAIHNSQGLDQPKCWLTGEWIKMCYIPTMKSYSAIQIIKQCHFLQHGWPREYHTTWSKLDRERWWSCDMAYMWNLKKNQMNLHMKQKWTHRRKDKLMVTKGEGG